MTQPSHHCHAPAAENFVLCLMIANLTAVAIVMRAPVSAFNTSLCGSPFCSAASTALPSSLMLPVLPLKILTQVCNLPYKDLKATIEMSAVAACLQKLLLKTELDGEKPSDLHHCMKQLVGHRGNLLLPPQVPERHH